MALSSGPCIGECIYCGARRYSSERVKLGREHVVPRGLGGQWTVLEASCKKCEGIINNEAENICQSRIMLGPLRYRLGLKPSGLTHLPINISYDGYYSYKTQIPIEKRQYFCFCLSWPNRDYFERFSIFPVPTLGWYQEQDRSLSGIRSLYPQNLKTQICQQYSYALSMTKF